MSSHSTVCVRGILVLFIPAVSLCSCTNIKTDLVKIIAKTLPFSHFHSTEWQRVVVGTVQASEHLAGSVIQEFCLPVSAAEHCFQRVRPLKHFNTPLDKWLKVFVSFIRKPPNILRLAVASPELSDMMVYPPYRMHDSTSIFSLSLIYIFRSQFRRSFLQNENIYFVYVYFL